LEDEPSVDETTKLKEILSEGELKVMSRVKDLVPIDDYFPVFEARYAATYNSCDMFFSSLFGDKDVVNDTSSMILEKENIVGGTMERNDNPPLFQNPLPSARRFTLLPIQAEKSVKELQLIRNLEKDRVDKMTNEKSSSFAAANAVSSSFGYFSSLLKKK